MIKTVHIVLGSPEHDELSFLPGEHDKVIGVDLGAIIVLNKRLQLDLAIGDFDSVTPAELRDIKAKAIDFKQFEAEKDDTDAEIALELAEKLYAPKEIIMYNWSGGRLDHLFNLMFFAYQPRFQSITEKVVFINKVNTIRFYKKGTYSLEKETEKYYLAFIGMSNVKGLSIEGVKYPVNNLNTDYPVTLVSNEITGGDCRFSFSEGLVAVIQSKK